MIPRNIYYIWFGGKPLNKEQKYCIKSWKKFFPDYNIVEINESNFDINSCQLSKVAYREKWYNFVSDYARLKIIYEKGGIYFDTDIEVIKDFRNIIDRGPYFGFAKIDDGIGYIATGLGFACEKRNELLKHLIKQYESWEGDSFFDDKNFSAIKACPIYNKPVFEEWGVKQNNQLQEVRGITFYPSCFFEAFDLKNRTECITLDTCSIHHYTSLGHPKIDRWYMKYNAKLNKKNGKELPYNVVKRKMLIYHPFKYLIYHFTHKKKDR